MFECKQHHCYVRSFAGKQNVFQHVTGQKFRGGLVERSHPPTTFVPNPGPCLWFRFTLVVVCVGYTNLIGSRGGQAGGPGSSWASIRSMISWRRTLRSRENPGGGGGQGNTEHQKTGGNFWWLVVCSYTYTAAIIVCSLFAIRFLHLYLGHLEDDFIQSVDINIMYIYIYIYIHTYKYIDQKKIN